MGAQGFTARHEVQITPAGCAVSMVNLVYRIGLRLSGALLGTPARTLPARGDTASSTAILKNTFLRARSLILANAAHGGCTNSLVGGFYV